MEAKPLEVVSGWGLDCQRGRHRVRGDRAETAQRKGHLHVRVGNGRSSFFLHKVFPGDLRIDHLPWSGPHLLP